MIKIKRKRKKYGRERGGKRIKSREGKENRERWRKGKYKVGKRTAIRRGK